MKRVFTLGLFFLFASLSIFAAALCDFPTGHLDNADFGDVNGRILLTVENIGTNQVRLTIKPNYANGATQKLDYLYVIGSSNIGNCSPYPATAGVDDSGTNYDEMSVDLTFPAGSTTATFIIQWSNPNWGGRWQANPSGVDLTASCSSSANYIYFVNTPNWANPYAYLWNGGDNNGWPGIAMTNASITTAKDNFSIWKVDYESYVNAIFSNNGANQSADQSSITEDRFFNYADNRWYTANDNTININAGGWQEIEFEWNDNSKSVLTAEIDLDASTTYEFYILGGLGDYFKNNGTMTSGNCTDWKMADPNNCHITTQNAGTYTFKYDFATNHLSVVYPKSSQCEGDLGHFATPATKRIHYTIEYLPLTNKIRYTVQGYGTQVLDYLEIQTSAGNSGNLTPSIAGGVATWLQTAPAAGTDMGINFVYSTDAIGGNEMNAESVPTPLSFTGNNANLVYYKSRDCEIVESCDASGNLARDKITKAGWARRGGNGGLNAAEDPDKAVDGSLTGNGFVSWGTDNAANNQYRWWAVDLGNEYVLNNIKVYWTNAGWTSNDYVLQVSDNPTDFTDDVAFSNTNWTTVKTIKGTQSNGSTANVSEVYATGRYVRLVANDIKNLGLLEFEVFGDACVSDLGGKPVLTSASLSSQTVYSSATLSLTGTTNGGATLHTFLLQDQMGNYRHVTTNGSNLVTIAGLENKRYTFTVWAYDNGVLSDETLTVVVGQEFFDPVQNLALNKPCVAHASQNGNPATNANDGYLNNLWNHGNGGADQAIPVADRNSVWWYVDLQDFYELRELDVWFEGAAATEFIFQIRNDAPTSAQANDDSEWTTFIHFTGTPSTGDAENAANRFGSGTNPVAAVNAVAYKSTFSVIPKGRYVRFRALNATNWDWGVKPREIRIYGNGYVVADANPPVMGTATYVSPNPGNTGAILELHATDEEGDVSSFKIVETGGSTTIVSTDGSNRATLDGIATGCAHTYTIYAIDGAGNLSDNSTTLILDFTNPAENLAVNKVARSGWSRTTAATGVNEAEQPQMAVDGYGGSDAGIASRPGGGISEHRQWGMNLANFPTKAWWAVDLGQKYQLSNIDIYWTDGDGNAPRSYLIQVSNESPADFANDAALQNLAWETVRTVSNAVQNIGEGAAHRNRFSFTTGQNVVARYIRIVNLDETRMALYLREFEVFAHAIVCDNNAPTMVSAAFVSNNVGNTGAIVELHANDAEDGADAVSKYKLLELDANGDPLQASYITTNAQHKYTIDGLTSGTHTYRVYAIDTDGNLSATYQTLSFCFANPAHNLALNKPVQAGMQENATTYKAANANNGNLADEWGTGAIGAGAQQNVWWYVDLGDVYHLSEIDIFFEGAYSRDFILQVRHTEPTVAQRADTLQWFTIQRFVGTPKAGASEEQKNDFSVDCKARYVRFQSFAQANDAWGCKIKDFRVYSVSCADEDNIVPVITTAEMTDSDAETGSATLHLVATDNLTANVTNFIVNNTTTSTKAEYIVNSSNDITLTGLDLCVPYSLQIQAKDSAANLSVVIPLVITIAPSTTVNIARSATPSAGFTEGGWVPANAIDGNLATQWQSTGATAGTNEWYTLDLGKIYDLNEVKIRWGLVAGVDDGGDYPTDFRLQVSDNNTTWASFAHYAQPTPIGSWLDVTSTDPLPARYVRVWVDNHAAWPMGIREIEVYSKNACYVADGKPVITLAELTAVNPTSVNVHCESWAAGKTHDQIRYYYELTNNSTSVTTTGTKTHTTGNFTFDGLSKGVNYTARIYAEIISGSVRSLNYKELTFSVTYSSLHYLTEETECNWETGIGKHEWQFKYTDNYAPTELDGSGDPLQILSYTDHTIIRDNGTPPTIQYKLYEAGIGSIWTLGGNLYFRNPKDKHLIMYALGTEKFVCNLDELYVSGEAVGGWWTASNAPNSATAADYRMTYNEETGLFSWTGDVVPGVGKYFKIVIRDIRSNNPAEDTWAFSRIMNNNQTYERDWTHATLYFDMRTWTWWWENAMGGCTREGGPGTHNPDPNGSSTPFSEGYKFDTYVQTIAGVDYLIVEAETYDAELTVAAALFLYRNKVDLVEVTEKETKNYTIGTTNYTYYRYKKRVSEISTAINGIIRYAVKFDGPESKIHTTLYHYFDLINKVCAPDYIEIYHSADPNVGPVSPDPVGAVYEYAGGQLVQPILYRRKFDPGEWHSICVPFDVDSVRVWDEDDQKYYRLKPLWDNGSRHDADYWLRSFDNDAYVIETGFQDNWDDPSEDNYKPEKNVPYIIRFPKGSYYRDKYVEFVSEGYQVIPTSAAFSRISIDASGTFKYGGNNTLSVINMAQPAYYLNDNYTTDGQQYFVQREGAHTLNPFECYVVSDTETMGRVKIIGRKREIPTQLENADNYGIQQPQIDIYSIVGQRIISVQNISVNDLLQQCQQTLPDGCYLLKLSDETLKIIVGGK